LSKIKGRDIIPGGKRGVFDELSIRIKLVWRLLLDRRVNILYKLLPIGSLIYLVNPFDIVGPIDDAILIWLGGTLFIELCPPEIVQEHLDALNQVIEGEWREIGEDEGEG
jgi:uncharacterized membrane protein YkvA (DUF1232 family)